jgi:uncharacterized protein (TIGR02001 family)
VRRTAAALGALLFLIEAHAQVSGRVALLSDYRFRGVSLSNGNPAAQVAVAYDRADGWYAGALLSTIRLASDTPRELQLLAYTGYAHRLGDGLSWELGADYARFTGPDHYAYPEIYAGLASEHLAARIYYAHNYFRSGVPAVYAELNATYPFGEHLYLFAHTGMLRRNGRDAGGALGSRDRYDIRAGIGYAWHAWNAQCAWVGRRGVSGHADADLYPTGPRPDDTHWVLSLSRAW